MLEYKVLKRKLMTICGLIMIAFSAFACQPPSKSKVTEDVVYAQGLTHSDWRAGDGKPMDLVLDVYEPLEPSPTKMPVIVLIHGGGFTGGTHKKPEFIEMADFFVENGFVVFSIDYRVVGDYGTLPSDYPDLMLDDATGKEANQWYALYPACRDAKAAIRWIRAQAEVYNLDTDRITAIGGSAGSILSVALGVSNEEDCVTEVTEQEDPTLAGTHLDQSSSVDTVIDHWGGPMIVKMLEIINPGDRFDASDAPVSIVHGTEDPTVLFDEALELKAEYERTGVDFAWYPLEGEGHGPWDATINGKSLSELALEFIIEQQGM